MKNNIMKFKVLLNDNVIKSIESIEPLIMLMVYSYLSYNIMYFTMIEIKTIMYSGLDVFMNVIFYYYILLILLTTLSIIKSNKLFILLILVLINLI